MGIYLRKSISVGPLRFNLSGSGIGVSAGIKGFRIGTGPRGNYVHMGRGGIYYRKTLPFKGSDRVPESASAGDRAQSPYHDPTMGPLIEIDSGDVSGMVDSSSAELLDEINEKKRKVRLGPIVAGLAAACGIGLAAAELPIWVQVAVAAAWVIAIAVAFRRDTIAKTVVLFYQFDPALERIYEGLHQAAAKLSECAGHWHISGSARVYDRKYHAGASAVVDRRTTRVTKTAPHFLKTNIATVSIGVGRQTMYLFPTTRSVRVKLGREEIVIPRGEQLRIIGRSDSQLMVSFRGTTVIVPASATDVR